MKRWSLAAGLLPLALLLLPSGASAHLRSGTVAVDYRISLVGPSSPAFQGRVYQSDRGLSLTLRPGHRVTLVGYLGEPVFRLDRLGLAVNAASPTAAAVGLLKKEQLVSTGAAVWRLERGKTSVAWHDSRAQRLPAGASATAWSVPLLVDGRAQRLLGRLQRVGRPSIVLWLAVLLAMLATAAAPLAAGVRDERSLQRSASIAAVAGALTSLVVALAFALDTYASPGTWIAGLDEIAFLAAGVWLLLRAPSNLRAAGAIGAGLVSLAVGLSKGSAFLHPIVLAVLPGDLTRVFVTAAIAAGAGAAMLGGAFYVRSGFPQTADETRSTCHPVSADSLVGEGAGRGPLSVSR